MTKPRLLIVIVVIAVVIPLFSLTVSCNSGQDLDSRLRVITKKYRFDFVSWEISALGEELGKVLHGPPRGTGDDVDEVVEYFNNIEEIRWLEAVIEAVKTGTREGDLQSLEDMLDRRLRRNREIVVGVEKTLETQIREALSRHGIGNPLDRYIGDRVKFPPVNFILEKPPHLLVVSPRDRIESTREIALLPEITRDEMEAIEAEVDKLGFVSLVVNLGGIATYPNFVSNRSSLYYTLNTASEEWLHQYLTFTPLGFQYVLDLTGIKRDYEIATMNETVAGIVSKEIGEAIYDEYYATEMDEATENTSTTGFDFNKEMREIRRAVDDYLSRGMITEAEEFMEHRRKFLVENGYNIRKLNQAYFAFHGTYADAPTSISPIGNELSELRNRSESLKDFLDTVVVMTSRQELQETVQ